MGKTLCFLRPPPPAWTQRDLDEGRPAGQHLREHRVSDTAPRRFRGGRPGLCGAMLRFPQTNAVRPSGPGVRAWAPVTVPGDRLGAGCSQKSWDPRSRGDSFARLLNGSSAAPPPPEIQSYSAGVSPCPIVIARRGTPKGPAPRPSGLLGKPHLSLICILSFLMGVICLKAKNLSSDRRLQQCLGALRLFGETACVSFCFLLLLIGK